MSAVLSSAPYKTPLIDELGHVSWPWIKWFDSHYEATTANTASIAADSFDDDGGPSAMVAAAIAELQTRAAIAERWDEGRLAAFLSDVSDRVALLDQSPGRLVAEVSDLQLQMALLPDAQPGKLEASVAELYALIAMATSGSPLAASLIVFDTHLNRLNYAATNYLMYVETDTTVTYVSVAGVWTYLCGSYAIVQTQVYAYQLTLLVGDAGTQVTVTDFAHCLAWQSPLLGWKWGPLDPGSGYVQGFWYPPVVGTVGWVKIDGSPITYLLPSGLTNTFTPAAALATSPLTLILGGGSAAAVSAAVAPFVNNTFEATTPVIINNPASGGTPVQVAPHNHLHADYANANTALASLTLLAYFRI